MGGNFFLLFTKFPLSKIHLLVPAFVNDPKDGPSIRVRKFHRFIDDEISIPLDDGFDFQAWHHYCFVFQSFPELPYPGGGINLTSKAYMDGVFIREGKSERKHYQANVEF